MTGPIRTLTALALLAAGADAQLAFGMPALETGHPTDFNGSFAFGDVNGDGLVDRVHASSDVFVALGLGDGSFAAPTTLGASTSVRIALGDVDGDTHLDLVRVADDGAFLHFGDGAGGFDAGQLLQTPGANPLRDLALGDLTGDGLIDVVTTSGPIFFGPMEVVLIRNLGARSFAVPVIAQGPIGSLSPEALAIGELDGDGVPDLVMATQSSFNKNVRIYHGVADGVPTPAGLIGLATTTAISDVQLVDLDDDGLLDLLLGTWDGVLRFAGDGAGGFGPVSVLSSERVHGELIVADHDQDGDLDVAFVNVGDEALHVLPGLGGGAFGPAFVQTGLTDAFLAAGADLDADGRPDLGYLAPRVGGGYDLLTLRSRSYLPGSPWTDLGQGKPDAGEPANQPFLLGNGTLVGGEPVGLSVARNQSSDQLCVVFIGLSELAAPFKGGTLVPFPDFNLAIFVASFSSTNEILATMPAGVPGGFELFFQAWFNGFPTPTWSASNALRATTP